MRRALVLVLVCGCGATASAPPAPPTPAPAPPARTEPSPIASATAAAPDPTPGAIPEPPLEPPFTPGPRVGPPPAPPPPAPAPAPTPAEERACAARGGKIEPVCMLGALECVLRYRDGGRRCTDKRDCTGSCLWDGAEKDGKPIPLGICQRTSDPCGCRAVIASGRVSPVVCAD